MNRKLLVSAGVLILIVLVGGIWLYNWALGDTQAASGPISAPTLAIEAKAATPQPTVLEPVAATAAPVAQKAATSTTAAPTQAAPGAAQAAAPAETQAAAIPATGLTVYQISADNSEAHFEINEVLRGSPKLVIGKTNQVAGEVALNPGDLSTVQIGEILIDARTLATDDDRRNNMIRNRILSTDQFEYISFKPTQISGLTGSGAPGQSYTFQVTGDLTIRDTTQPVTFDVTVTAESPEKLSGSAKATIKRADFNLNIPSVPFVANVGDTVNLQIDFVLIPK